jgi:hypothetical protein
MGSYGNDSRHKCSVEREGEKTAFLVTEGFKDILQIENQSRPYMFDLAIRRPTPLYSDVFEVKERVVLQQCSDSDLRSLQFQSPEPVETVVGTSGEVVQTHASAGCRRHTDIFEEDIRRRIPIYRRVLDAFLYLPQS